MNSMAYQRQLLHNARANPPPGWQGESPNVHLYRQQLADHRQAFHMHNAHVRETTANTNEYVREMVLQAYGG